MANQAQMDALRKRVEQDPHDELAQFSLGNALLESGNPQEAAQCLQRVLALNGQHSKAYHLLGAAQKACGDTQLAIQTLRNGYIVAQKRGDIEPMNEMAALLRGLDAEVPAVGQKKPVSESGGAAASGDWTCARCGGHGPKLKDRPFKGKLGEEVLERVCQSCWREWVGMGTKVINELRLPMYDPGAQEMYDKHMKEFLGLE